MMNFFVKVTLMSFVFSITFSVTPLIAAQGTGAQVQANHEAFQDFYGADSLGEAVSAGYMGNTSNPRPSGNGVTPSLAPGIWICTYGGTFDPNSGEACGPVVKGNPFGEFVSGASKGQGKSQ